MKMLFPRKNVGMDTFSLMASVAPAIVGTSVNLLCLNCPGIKREQQDSTHYFKKFFLSQQEPLLVTISV